MANIFFCL